MSKAANSVRNLSCAGDGNLTADGVWHLLVTDFRNHGCAADLFLSDAGNPASAADGSTWTLFADRLAAAGVAWILNTPAHDRTWNVFGVCLPASAADINRFGGGDGSTNGITLIAIAGLCFRAILSIAFVAVAGCVHRLADVVTDGAIAGLVNRLADVIANVTIAGCVDRLANVAGNRSPAGFHHWLADLLLDATVTSFIDGPANRIALITIARLIDVSCT